VTAPELPRSDHAHERSAAHWDDVYVRTEGQGSWERTNASDSVDAITRVAPSWPCRVLDVGGGDGPLGSVLLAHGVDVTVTDLSSEALRRNPLHSEHAERLLLGDVLVDRLPETDVWHDRAVLHFLLHETERTTYLNRAATSVIEGGGIVVAGFAEDGPERCSGLVVARRDPSELASEFALYFDHVATHEAVHVTPGGVAQNFSWFLGRRNERPAPRGR
jgi:16S rRNA G1207 methylase RsmC